MCPPASEPSMTIASAPERTRRRASTNAGAKQINFAPPSLTALTALPDGMPPASTTWVTRASRQTRTRSSSAGCMVIRLTPNGLVVIACVPAISAASRSGVIEPQAITPKPPAFEIADTRCRSLTQLIAPPMTAIGQPRKSVPRAQRWFNAARSCGSGIETIGGMQRANRELGEIGGDQHADLDLAGGNHLNVDRLVRQRAEHGVGDAGVAAHADAHHAYLGDIRVLQHVGPADLVANFHQRGMGARQVGLADGEGHVGHAVRRAILHDHVDVDVFLGQTD